MAEENGSYLRATRHSIGLQRSGKIMEAHKPLIETKKWSDPGAVLTSYSELEKMVGQDKFVNSGKDATPEDYRKIYSPYLVCHPTLKAMSFRLLQIFEEYDKTFVDIGFVVRMHKAGLTPAQAEPFSRTNLGKRMLH